MARKNFDVSREDQASFYEEQRKKTSQPSEQPSESKGSHVKSFLERSRQLKKELAEKKQRGVASEDVDTIREEELPTVLEGEDLQEVDEDGFPKSEAPSLDEFYKGLGGREQFDQQIADIEGRLDPETLEEIQRIIDASEEEIVDFDPEFDEQFNKVFERVDQRLDQAIGALPGEVGIDVDDLVVATEALTSDAEKLDGEESQDESGMQEVSVQTEKELRVWDTDLGRQRVESLAKIAKKGLSKAGGLLKGFFGGRIKESLSSFGSTIRDLGYGTVALGENLPKAGIKKLSSGVKTIASESVLAYKKVTIELSAEVKRTKEKMTVWQEERKEKSEREEYVRLSKQRDRFLQLQDRFKE